MTQFGEFIDLKRRQHEQALERRAIRGTKPKFRMRLRVRFASKIASDGTSLKFSFLGRRVTMRSRKKGDLLNSSYWIVFTAARFSTIEAAAAFGIALQSGLAVVGSANGIPVDVGADNCATSMFGDVVKAAVAKTGGFLLDDVHGVDIYADLPNAIVIFGEATATTSFSPTRIIEPLERMGRGIEKLERRSLEAAFLMNAAHMAQHPVAMLTLAVAAVEMLASGEKWNAAQKEWIKSLRSHVAEDASLSGDEKNELRQAVDSLFNFGALAKTRRLLNHLSLQHLRPRWEELYRGRSSLFHGNEYLPYSQVQALGGEARLVCKEIVDAYLSRALGSGSNDKMNRKRA
jgi:hypothetical protein